MDRLDGKVVIVTGMSRGTGEEIFRSFVREGARVLGVDLLDDRGRAVVAECGVADRAVSARPECRAPEFGR